MCKFETNVPYAFISSALTFWFPVIIMLAVYYKVFKEAMKQKKNMERMNNIRTLPVTNKSVKNSFESDKTNTDLLEQSNSSDEIGKPSFKLEDTHGFFIIYQTNKQPKYILGWLLLNNTFSKSKSNVTPSHTN